MPRRLAWRWNNAACAAFALEEGLGLEGCAVVDPDEPEFAVCAATLAGRNAAVVLFADDAADVLEGHAGEYGGGFFLLSADSDADAALDGVVAAGVPGRE